MDYLFGTLLFLSLPWTVSPYFLLKLVGLRWLQVFIHHMIHRPDAFGKYTKIVAWMCSWLCGWPFYETFSDVHKYNHLIQTNRWNKGSIFSIDTLVGIFYLPIHGYKTQTVYLVCSGFVWILWLYCLGFTHWFTTLITFVISIVLFTSKNMTFTIVTKHMKNPSEPFYSLDKDSMWQWFFSPVVSPMLHFRNLSI